MPQKLTKKSEQTPCKSELNNKINRIKSKSSLYVFSIITITTTIILIIPYNYIKEIKKRLNI